MPNVQPSLDSSEHIGLAVTGDNIEAKRAANYQWNGTVWQRALAPLIDGNYDYTAFSNPDVNGNYQTISFKSGGSGGTLIRTLNLTFDGNGNITSIARS